MEYFFLGIICGAIVMCCVPSQCQESTRIIRMVVLLPSNGSRLFSIQRVYPAFELGMERVVSDDILPSYNLSLKFGDSKCSIADGMNEAIGFYARKDVDVFFGPCCDYAAAPVGRQTRYWDKPMVTAGAMARDFGLVKKRMFPMMTRVGTTFDSLVEMVMTILLRFQWSKVKLIYNPDGQAHIVDRFCHIVTDGIHHGLRTETKMGIFHHKYRKFHRKNDILDHLDYELGNSYGSEESYASRIYPKTVLMSWPYLRSDALARMSSNQSLKYRVSSPDDMQSRGDWVKNEIKSTAQNETAQ